MRRSNVVRLGAYAAAAACVLVPASLAAWSVAAQADYETLPGGGWTVAARDAAGGLLVSKPARAGQAEGKRGERGPAETLAYAEGAQPQRGRAERAVAAAEANRPAAPVHVGQLGGRRVAFNPVADGPRLLASPASPDEYVFEYGQRIWRVSPGGQATPLTADETQGVSRQALQEALQNDEYAGFWALDPRWSPDGRYVAYATTRMALRTPGSGQQVWLVEARGGTERPLLAEAGRSYGIQGWLGRELVFTDDSGTLSAVDVESGAKREIAAGASVVAVDERGGALAYAEWPSEGAPRITVVSGQRTAAVPAAPAGFAYETTGSFSPNGQSLVLAARGENGAAQLAVFSAASGQVAMIPLEGVPGTHSLSDPPAWITNSRVLVTLRETATGREVSRVYNAARGS